MIDLSRLQADRSLAQDFQFSQSNLQDFRDCQRRFQLRYIFEFAWPAVESEPALENERSMQRGSQFHRMAQQYFVGLPVERLNVSVADPDLQAWWDNFLDFTAQAKFDHEYQTLPEFSLAAALGNYRLTAKYDLLASTDDGRFLIYDWKTNQRLPKRQWLAERLQTRIYPYLLARAGAALNHGRAIDPASIEMIYWFSAYPQDTLSFPYSAAQFERDQAYLQGLIEQIASLEAADFHLTSDEKRCVFCRYRSLCGRGEKAGNLDEQIDPGEAEELHVDFEQIAEIEF